MRRRPRPDLVRHELRNLPPELVLNAYSEEVVRLRGAMKQALDLLDADVIRGLVEARGLLRETLRREAWWRR